MLLLLMMGIPCCVQHPSARPTWPAKWKIPLTQEDKKRRYNLPQLVQADLASPWPSSM
jgi:hypothetical protein